MNFEFLIVCNVTTETDIRQSLAELLTEALQGQNNDLDEETVLGMIQLRYQRPSDQIARDAGQMSRRTLIGFDVEMHDDIEAPETVITEFVSALPSVPPILHVLKFEDPLLHHSLAERAVEIFAVEMKLRRVLSLIYLHACQDGEPFDLLREEVEQIPRRERPSPSDMRRFFENQFFHLVFSQYASLNQRKKIDISEMLDIVRDSEQYESLRAEILRSPISEENDSDLLANLKELLDPIERMRNCVAHNRTPSPRISSNYLAGLQGLNDRLDDYLATWKIE